MSPIGNKKIIIVSSICLIAFLAIAFFIIYPAYQAIIKSSASLNKIKDDLILFEQKSGDTDEMKEEYSQWKPSLEKAGKMLIDSEVPIDFIKFLESATKDCNLSSDISTSASQKKDSDLWESISFQIILRGSFDDTLRFLDKIQSAPYLIEPQSFNARALVAVDPSDKAGNVSATLSIKVYAE